MICYNKSKKIYFYIVFALSAMLFLSIQTSSAKAASIYSKIATPNTKTYTKIYKSNSASSAYIGKFRYKDGGSILKKGTTWTKIKSGNITGYVKNSKILSGSSLEYYAKQNKFPRKITVKVSSLRVRSQKSTTSSIITGISLNESFPVIAVYDEWIKIKVDGCYGYVSSDYVDVSYAFNDAVVVSASVSTSSTSKTASSPNTAATISTSKLSSSFLPTVDDFLNVRKSANSSSSIVGVLTPTCSGTILSKGSSWSKIKSGSVTGYICNKYYVSGSKIASYAEKNKVTKVAKVISNTHLRTSKNSSSASKKKLYVNSTCTIKNMDSTWLYVSYQGKTGYILRKRCTLSYQFDQATKVSTSNTNTNSQNSSVLPASSNSSKVTGSQIVSYAMQFKGNPYVWGGTSLTSGCDCSGFVMSIYKHFGYSISRTSREQATNGILVSLSSLQKGDLVFYANSSGTINHVALYIGNGQVINASCPAYGITVNKVNYRTPVKARRILR